MTASVNEVKVYVSVLVAFDSNGTMYPRALVWEDGHKYSIDKVLDIRQAAAMKAGGQGDRYTIMVNGQQRYLFFERSTDQTGNNIGRWFVERKAPPLRVIGHTRMSDNRGATLYSDGTIRRNGQTLSRVNIRLGPRESC